MRFLTKHSVSGAAIVSVLCAATVFLCAAGSVFGFSSWNEMVNYNDPWMQTGGGKTDGGPGGSYSPVLAYKAWLENNFESVDLQNALFAAMGWDPKTATSFPKIDPVFWRDFGATLEIINPGTIAALQKEDYTVLATGNALTAADQAKLNETLATAAATAQATAAAAADSGSYIGKYSNADTFIADMRKSGLTFATDATGGVLKDARGRVDTAATDYLHALQRGTGVSLDPGRAACDSVLIDGKYEPVSWLSESSTGGSGGTGSTGGGGTTAAITPQAPVVGNTTNAAQTMAKVPLSVSTDRTANCRYSLSSGFAYASGTAFSTTGSYNHNTDLNDLSNGKQTYYVICEDVTTKGVSAALKIEFTIDLSKDPNNQPIVSSTTPAAQNNADPKLSVTTDRPAACQYKEGATFSYGGGTTMSGADDNHGHSASIADFTDGSHNFYVVCKDNATGAASSAKQIATALDRQGGTGGAPTITNTTNPYQSTASPVITVTTTRNAVCQYKKDGSFGFGAGTDFSATNSAIHSAALSGLSDGQYTFYVVCKDSASGAVNSQGAQVIFTVAVSAPSVSSTTPATQTGADSKLSVTTDRTADCQYKEGGVFSFGTGTAMISADNGYSHNALIAALADGTHTFYVVCHDAKTAKDSPAKKIDTNLNRSGDSSGVPAVTNTTPGYQTVNNPILSVGTDSDSECRYGLGDFSFANGAKFENTGGRNHGTELENLSNGQHAYYVVCKRNSNNLTSPGGYQIIFTVNTTSDSNACTVLSSNDRRNDGNRSVSGDTESDSVYPWQSVETGTREKFDNVDWEAGYQFTPEKDGQVTQLCGYFENGVKSTVSLYNGSYAELARAEVAGNGKWKCVNVSPAAIKMDSRYYVIAKIEGDPIYFEYNPSGLLPIDANGIMIEYGVRQAYSKGEVKSDIVKYDYMIFGLVDIKVSFASVSDSGPEISSAGPSGRVYDTSVSIMAETGSGAECRFDRRDADYPEMSYSLPKTSSGSYSQKICGLEDGDYTFYIRCKDGSGINNGSKAVQFKVEQ